MVIIIVCHKKNDIANMVITKAIVFFKAYGIEYYIDTYPNELSLQSNFDDIVAKTDFVMTIGGDGTVLRAISKYHNKPIISINNGRVGFIAQFEPSEVTDILNAIRTNTYEIQKLLRIEARIGDRFIDAALNEVVVRSKSRDLEAEVIFNNSAAKRYHADALIFSTSVGSTGYNLSAKGPVIHHDLDCIIVNPICSYLFSDQPIVLHPDVDLKIVLSKGDMLIFDGKNDNAYELQDNDVVTIKKHPKPAQLVKKPGEFINTLISKLRWGV